MEAQAMTKAELAELVKTTAAEALAPAIKDALAPLTKAQGDQADLIKRLAEEQKAKEPDLGPYRFGRRIRAMALAMLDLGRPVTGTPDDVDAAVKAVKKHWRLALVEPTVKWLEMTKATLLAGNAGAAGDMVMPHYDPEWIELLRNNAVVRGIARTIPMPRGATSRRRQQSAATASYQGETDRIVMSNLTVGRVPLSYKKLTTASVVGNDLIRFSSGEADRVVQEDLLAVAGLREDRAFLVGNPPTDSGSPQGVRYQTAAANVNASGGAALSNFQADLTAAIRRVQASNVPATPDNSYFLMSASTFWTIYALATTTGDMIFASTLSGAQPRLFGFPVKITTQLEVTNSFIGASSGLVFFVHGPSLEIHDSMQRTIAVYPGGAYYDAALAAVASGISNDETVITCIAEHDFFQKYDTAASVITGYAT